MSQLKHRLICRSDVVERPEADRQVREVMPKLEGFLGGGWVRGGSVKDEYVEVWD
jgi:hypothetical protein